MTRVENMRSFGHYLNDYDLRNISDTVFFGDDITNRLPLFVNCAGFTYAGCPHINANDRGRPDYYLIYVLSDGMYVLYQDKWTQLVPGSVFIVPPNTPYKHRHETETTSFFWTHFTGNDAKSILKRYKIEPFPSIYRTSAVNNISSRFQKLFEGFARNDSYKFYDLAALLDRLLIEIGRAIEKNKTEKVSLSKSIRYLNENYTSQIKIPALAQMENMCMTAYNMAFKKQMSISPTKYIIKLRISSAKELLCTTNMAVQKIGSLCGYDDVNFFRKTFKKETGLSPSDYRKKFSLI